jgi:hypothetical protein
MKLTIQIRHVLLRLIIALVLIFIMGCGEGSNGDGGGGQPLTIKGASGNQVNLNGNWEGMCNPSSDDKGSVKIDLMISGTSFLTTANDWSSSIDCSGASDLNQTVSATFAIVSEVTATMNGSNATATAIYSVKDSTTITFHDAGRVSDANMSQFCGFDDWVVDTPKELLGTSCWFSSDYKELYYIDDTADPDVLYEGINGQGAVVDEQGYPTVIDIESAKERI